MHLFSFIPSFVSLYIQTVHTFIHTYLYNYINTYLHTYMHVDTTTASSLSANSPRIVSMAKQSTGSEQALLMGFIDRLRSSGFEGIEPSQALSSLVYLLEGWQRISARELNLRSVINSEVLSVRPRTPPRPPGRGVSILAT
jgi:hypothetical protein